MATKDFSSKQIRVSQLLASGGIAGTSVGMAIYSASNASNLEGGISDSAIFNDVGSDVFLFVSGTANVVDNNRTNVTLFGGDVVVSGTLYAERQIIEVDETVTGSLLISGSMIVSQSATIKEGLTVNSSKEGGVENDFTVYNDAGAKSIFVDTGVGDVEFYGTTLSGGAYLKIDPTIEEVVVNPDVDRSSLHWNVDFRVASKNKDTALFVDASTNQVLILSGGAASDPNESSYADVAFFVSGSTGSKGTSIKGTSLFGGDLHISGNLTVDGTSPSGGNTLDQAYDQGGAGAGREINVDSGAVQINTISGTAFLITGSAGTQLFSNISGDDPVFTITNTEPGSGQDAKIQLQSDYDTSNVRTPSVPYNTSIQQTGEIFGIIQHRTVGTAASSGRLVIGQLSLSGDQTYSIIQTGSAVGTDDLVMILSGTTMAASDPNPVDFTDTSFFVSGAIGSKDGSVRGMSVFGGDVLSSGSIYATEFYGDLQGAIRFSAINDEGDSISKGQVVYIKGIQGQTPTVALAACDDPNKMPAFGLAATDAADQAAVEIVTAGDLSNFNINTLYGGVFSEGDVLYVATGSNHTSGSLTNIRPKGGENLLQNMGFVVRDGGGGDSRVKVGGAGRSNATPNLNDGQIFIGDSTNCSSTASLGLNLAYASGSGAIIGVDGQPIQLQPVASSGEPVLAISGSVFTSGTFYHVAADNFVNSSYSLNFNIKSASLGGSNRTDFNVSFARAGNPSSGDTFFSIRSGSATSNTQYVALGDALGTDVYTAVGGPDFLAGNDSRVWYGIYNDAQRSAIYLMSGAVGTAAESNPKDMTDLNFYVSGTIGGKGTEGTSVFGGDVVISGALHGGSPLQIGEHRNDLGSDVVFFVSGSESGKNTEGVSLFGGDTVVSGVFYSVDEMRAFNNIRISDTQGNAFPTLYMNAAGSVKLQEDNNSLFIDGNNNLYLIFDDSLRFSADAESNPVFVCSNSPGTFGIKGSLFNHGQDSDQDFSVSTTNQKRAIFVSSSDDSVMIHAEGLPPAASDTHFFVSGSQGGKNISGTAVFGGDVVISGSLHGGSPLQIGEYQPDVGTDVVLYVSGTTPSGGGGKGTPNGTTVLNSDLVVSGTYRGGYDPAAGSESFQAISDNYLFMSSDADFGSPQIEATDSNFFFTGSIGSRGGGTPGTAVFGGDLHVSGAITADGGAPAPTYRYVSITSVPDVPPDNQRNTARTFVINHTTHAAASDVRTHYCAPASGSIVRVIYSPLSPFAAADPATSDRFLTSYNPQFFVRKNDIADYGTNIHPGMVLHTTASAENMKTSVFNNGNGTITTQTVIFDLENNQPFVSGSNSFNPGDILLFNGTSGHPTSQYVRGCTVSIILKLDESTVYP